MSITLSNSINTNNIASATEATSHTATLNPNSQLWEGYSKQLKQFNSGSISVTELLALISQIIESSQRLRSQLMNNRIGEAVATSELARKIAGDKCSDSRKKFAITLAAGVLSMGVSTVAGISTLRNKKLDDKMVTKLSNGTQSSVKSLSAADVNKFNSELLNKNTNKFRAVEQLGKTSESLTNNANEIQHAAQVRQQEETQASRELKEKFDSQIDQYIQNLTQEHVKLNEILNQMEMAKQANMR
ncbi:type III secretion system protein [Vibrio cholerae]|uniref:type III secretion system protein n=1 Tax=Vibrio cholerae TaxID=666 RepID=UPI002D895FE7|nr:type III secretion system protein [Vibrio cholerae]EGQ8442520.1 type III secretion system protein [Vibrio cholerae]EGR1312020.1 type III secretion system protein [Vibrio cholerae]MEB5517851.1 type III secretion system protein [Vibrio cholerae]